MNLIDSTDVFDHPSAPGSQITSRRKPWTTIVLAGGCLPDRPTTTQPTSGPQLARLLGEPDLGARLVGRAHARATMPALACELGPPDLGVDTQSFKTVIFHF